MDDLGCRAAGCSHCLGSDLASEDEVCGAGEGYGVEGGFLFQAALRIKNRIAGVLQRNYPLAMNAMETMLAAVADTFDANALSALVEMRAPQEAAERMAYLAERANEGLLKEEERHEYHSAISFGNFLGLLQSKARMKLNSAA